jgi:outer membrane immunogenic protein
MASTSSTGFPVKASVSRTTSNWSWTGFYLGINAGYGVATDQFRQTSTNVTSPFPTPLVAGNTVSSTIAPKGGLLGFQGGFNYQTGSVVLGVEGDWQWANQTATACGTSCFFRTTPGFIGTAGNTLSRFEKVAWLATARGRVGWTPIDGAMIYVTGGGAWMGIDESDRLSASDAPFFPDEASAASFSNSVSGYVMGAGAELRLWGNWTGKLEYLHLDVGGTTTSALHSGPNIIGPLVLATATGRIRDDIVRLGLNYKLGSWTP